jgi:hypothetical protein
MKLTRALMFIVSILLLGVGLFAQATPATTIEGTLVDGRCYMMNPANSGDADGNTKACGMLCLNSGAPAAVLTADKQFHPLTTFAYEPTAYAFLWPTRRPLCDRFHRIQLLALA